MFRFRFYTLGLWFLMAVFMIPASVFGYESGINILANQVVEIRPDIGPSIPGLKIGKNGYKVFNPGAIKTVSLDSPQGVTATVTRTGATDAYLVLVAPWDLKLGWHHRGSHTSQSTITETNIWSDGFLRKTVDSPTTWRASCSDRRSAQQTWCQTNWDALLAYKIYAKTNHYFSTPGYTNSSFTTSDTA